MAKEFWEIFLPQDITILSVRWDGVNGHSWIKFTYPDHGTPFIARFIRSLDGVWHLDSIDHA
jgi:hypothetical protein